MPVVIADCYIVSVKGESGGQDIVNVLGFYAPGNTAISVANAVSSAWKVTGGPLSKLPSQYVMKETKAMSINSLNGDIHVIGENSPGAIIGPLATNGSCALVTYGAGTRAKSERGRMYFGPLREADINTDGRTIASVGTFNAAFDAFRTAVNLNGRTWSVLSRKNLSHTPIITIATQNVIGTQRRRIR